MFKDIPHSAALLAQRQLDAYNKRDIESFAACYSDEIKLIRLQSGEIFCDGKAQLIESYSKMFAEKNNLHCVLVKRMVCGEIAIDEEQVAGLAPGSIVHAIAMYEVKNSLIVRAWFARGD